MWLTQFSRPRSITIATNTTTTTTLGVRETLDSDDGDGDDDDGELEWDRSDFARRLPESDALSSYDVDEMSEMFHRPFLDFDLSSALAHRSSPPSPCSINDRWISETYSHRSLGQRPISRSLCDVSSVTQGRDRHVTQHMSLSDLRSTHLTGLTDMPGSHRFAEVFTVKPRCVIQSHRWKLTRRSIHSIRGSSGITRDSRDWQ